MKTLTFPQTMVCTHIKPDGTKEDFMYNQYETIQIVSENGWSVGRTKILIVPSYLVTEVVKEDGTKVVFRKPFYCIETKKYNDNSNREAPSI